MSVLQAQVPVLGSRAKSRQARDGRLRESLLISSIWRRMESYYFVQGINYNDLIHITLFANFFNNSLSS